MIIRSILISCECIASIVLDFRCTLEFEPEVYNTMSVGNFTPQKMIQHSHETSQPTDAHWCVALVPEDEAATVTYLQGRATQNLTFEQAENKALELNQRMSER